MAVAPKTAAGSLAPAVHMRRPAPIVETELKRGRLPGS